MTMLEAFKYYRDNLVKDREPFTLEDVYMRDRPLNLLHSYNISPANSRKSYKSLVNHFERGN